MRATSLLGLLLAGLQLLVAAVLWPRLPDPMPIHWGLDGTADGFGSKWLAVLLGPGWTAAIALLLPLALRFERRQEHIRRSADAIGVIQLALAAFFTGLHGLTLRAALSPDLHLQAGSLTVLVGVLFVVLGNVLPRIRSNRLVGIRTPWTLADEVVWTQTHRLGGWCGVATGLLVVLTGAFAPPAVQFGAILVLILLFALLPCGYSWWLFRQLHHRQ
ncbi:MAG: SdpI family protein [Fimbriimonadaceae bacterium]|nr:SdpI family protein [Fimbriimonadaceae bacterium]